MKKAMIMILATLMSGCANSAKEDKPVTSFIITTKTVQITAPVTTQSRYTTTADTKLKHT